MNLVRYAFAFEFLLAAAPAAMAQVEVAPPPHASRNQVVKESLRFELPLPPNGPLARLLFRARMAAAAEKELELLSTK